MRLHLLAPGINLEIDLWPCTQPSEDDMQAKFAPLAAALGALATTATALASAVGTIQSGDSAQDDADIQTLTGTVTAANTQLAALLPASGSSPAAPAASASVAAPSATVTPISAAPSAAAAASPVADVVPGVTHAAPVQ